MMFRHLSFVLPLALLGSASLLAQSAPPAPEVATMQAVEDTWDSAVTKHDQFALENLLGHDFVGIGATGDVTTRNQQIAHLFVPGEEPVSLSQKVIGARVIGDIAIVNGTYVMKWKGDSAAAPVDEKGVFTHVFRKNTAGAWQCINSQRTVVATEEERKKKQQQVARPKSNAELPMHIPLVYTGPKSTQATPPANTDKPQP